MVFSISHILIRELEVEHCRIWCFWTVVLEKTCESPLDSKEIKPVNPKGNQPWIFIGRTDAEALILWPPDENSWLIEKDPDAGKNWRQKKGVTEDEMVGCHHQFNGHELGQTPGDGGQRSLECYSPWGCKQTWLSNWTTVTNKFTLTANPFKPETLKTAPFSALYYDGVRTSKGSNGSILL